MPAIKEAKGFFYSLLVIGTLVIIASLYSGVWASPAQHTAPGHGHVPTPPAFSTIPTLPGIPALATCDVNPASATLIPGGTQQFSYTGSNINNTVISGLTVTWSVVAGGGTINSSGLFTAGSTLGTFTNTVRGSGTQAGDQICVAFATVIVVPPSGTVPGAPTNASATPGNTQATVTWSAPVSDGGSAITSYTVTSSPGALIATVGGSTLTATVTGLTNGVSYTFTVVAANPVGSSAASAPSNPVRPATVPGAPTIGTATAGPGQATVTWSTPSSDGGSPITSYTVTSSPGGFTATVSGASLSATVSGLTNGTSYTFTVTAKNAVGTGAASTASNSVTPATVPNSPTNVAVTKGDSLATVTWSAPASSGGSAITSYRVTSDPQGQTATTPNGVTLTATVSGLVNGVAYTFTVTATNAVGTSASSAASGAVTPAALPGAPTIGTATAGNTQVTVTWTAPASNGGSTITSYTVTSSPGGFTATVSGATLTAVVTGLTNGTPYTFTVVATNAVGVGPASAGVSATPAGAPGAPTIGTATAGNTQATVSWTAPVSNGGSPIISYTVTSSPGGFTATVNGATLTAVVTGLTNGTPYTFTVRATNAFGTSAASAASGAVTPVALPGAPSFATATPGNTQATVTWSAPVSNGGSPITSYTVTSSPGGLTATWTTGALTATVTGLTNGTKYTFTVTATTVVGTGPASAASNAVTPAGFPGAPTGVAATAGDGAATVTWSAPVSDGGSPITSYTVTSSTGGFTATWTFGPLTAKVTGLTNGTPYTFTVTAKNAVGAGAASTASSAITPAAAPSAPVVSTPASPTNAATVTLSVNPSVAGTIRVTGGATTVNAAVVSAGLAQNVVVTLNTNQSNTLAVTVININNVQSTAVTRVVVQDSTTPAAPTVVSVSPKSPTLASSVTLNVIAEPGSTITVTGGGSTVTAGATGSAQNVVIPLTANATNNLSVTATDLAGNVSGATAAAVVQDSTVPVTPTVPQPGSPTSASTVTLSVTAEAGSKITITGGAQTVIATATGSAQNVVVTLTANATNTMSITATDAAGNVSGAVSRTVVQDALAPSAPTVSTPPSATNQTSVTLSVTAEAVSTISVTGGLATVTATATGSAQNVTVNLNVAALNTLSVTATDTAGNVSNAVVRTVVQDSTAPANPTVSTPTSPTSQTSVTLTVTAEAGSKITITGGAQTVIATATGGAQSIVVPLTPNSTNSLSVKVTDAAGNDSGIVARTVVMNTIAPAPPTVNSVTPSSPTNLTSVTLSVTATLGNTIRVTGGTATVTAASTGSAQNIAVNLNLNAINNLGVTATDNAANVSAEVVVAVVQDSTQPAAPTVSTPFSPTSASSVTLVVQAETGSTIQVTGGAQTVSAKAIGTVSVVVNLTPNIGNNLVVRAIDAAGNQSTAVVRVVVQDSITPALSVSSASSPTKASSIGVNVTTEVGASITVTGGASTTTAIGTGSSQQVVVSLTADATNTLVFTATDAVGNVSAPITRVVVQDSTAPVVPTVSTPPTSTTAASIALQVTAEAGSTIKVTGGAATVTAAATGFSQSVAISLTENATNVLVVTASDAAGNVSSSVTRTVARTPALSEIRGSVIALDLSGATATAKTGSTERTVSVNPNDGSFVIDNLNPQTAFTVRINGTSIVTSFFKAGAAGNVTTIEGNATGVTPGAAGVFLQMSVRIQPAITVVSGGGNNDIDRTLTVTGTALDSPSEVWLISGNQAILLTGITSVSSTEVQATIKAGTPAGTYRVQVRTPAGLSPLSTGTVSVTAVATLPIVTGLSQVTVVRGASPIMTLTGTNFTGATDVSIVTGDAQVSSVPPVSVTATSLKVTLPATLDAGIYIFRVTTAAGTGSPSASFEVRVLVDVTGVTNEQVINDPVTVPAGGLDAEITLTNEGVRAVPGAATAAVQMPKGAQFTDNAGQAITEPLLPPRPVPVDPSLPADSVAIALGLVEGRVNLSVPMVMQVTTKGTSGGLANSTLAPKVYLQISAGPPPVFELAGITGTLDSINYVPGGVVLSETSLGGGVSSYLIGVLLNRFSTFVASVEDLIPNTAPGAPTNVVATPGNTQATVTWNAPVDNGGASITSYTVTSSPGNLTFTTISGSILTGTLVGLSNGVSYTFTVVATNVEGSSASSNPSNAVTLATVPGAPSNVAATIGDGQSIVSWVAPASNGGSSITGYRVTSSPGSPNSPRVVGSVTTSTMTGLTNNTITYTFTVEAINPIGSSAASPASNAVTPAAADRVPNAPTNVVATIAGIETQATVTWAAPAFVGGSLLTGYRVTSTPGALTATVGGATLTATVTGLTRGTAYTFTVVASNDAGASAASVASNAVTSPTVPGAPTIGTATAGPGQATVTWVAPVSNGGSPITGYTVTSSPGALIATVGGSTLTATVSGLTGGVTYTFTVVATNAVGNSVASAASNAVTVLSGLAATATPPATSTSTPVPSPTVTPTPTVIPVITPSPTVVAPSTQVNVVVAVQAGTTATGAVVTVAGKQTLVTTEQQVNVGGDVGSVKASISVDLVNIPANASLSITVARVPDASASASFTLAATNAGTTIRDVAFVMNVTRTNLSNVTNLGEARITMVVSEAWVLARGGPGAVRIFRVGDEGETEILKTVIVGRDGQGNYIFQGISPRGLSVFAIVALEAAPPVAVPPGGAIKSFTPGTATTLSSPDGRVTVIIPGSAPVGAGFLLYTPKTGADAPAAAPAGLAFGTALFDLTGLDASGAVVPTTLFNTSITISVKYADADVQAAQGNPARLVLYKYDSVLKAWTPLTTTYNPVAKTVEAQVSRLSFFALMGQAQPSTPTPTPIATLLPGVPTPTPTAAPPTATKVPTATLIPPKPGDVAPGSGLLIGLLIAAFILISAGGYYLRQSRQS